MNYYEIYDSKTGTILARGNVWECIKQLGCASPDSFYSLVNRSLKGINKKYKVKVVKGGLSDYPVLGKKDPIYKDKQ